MTIATEAWKYNMTERRNEYFPLKNETDELIGIGIDIHKQLGFGFLEIVYKDAFEYELTKPNVFIPKRKGVSNQL